MCTKDTAAAGELLGQIAKTLENAPTVRILIAYQTIEGKAINCTKKSQRVKLKALKKLLMMSM